MSEVRAVKQYHNLKILTNYDPGLRVVCRSADAIKDNLGELKRKMTYILREKMGVGLAAPQVGVDGKSDST